MLGLMFFLLATATDQCPDDYAYRSVATQVVSQYDPGVRYTVELERASCEEPPKLSFSIPDENRYDMYRGSFFYYHPNPMAIQCAGALRFNECSLVGYTIHPPRPRNSTPY